MLSGRRPAALLATYSAERQPVAQQLIDFDRFWSAFIAEPTTDPDHPERGGVTAEQMRTEFARQGRYMAGLATKLPAVCAHRQPARISTSRTASRSARASTPPPWCGSRTASTCELGHAHRADGRWRLYAFGDETGAGLIDLATWLSDAPESPVRRFTPRGRDLDHALDVHAIFPGDHHAVDLGRVPEILLPHSGPLGLQDWEKIWAMDAAHDIFDMRSVGREGAIVIVRPDQYVAHVLPLHARGDLTDFFSGILLDQLSAVAR